MSEIKSYHFVRENMSGIYRKLVIFSIYTIKEKLVKENLLETLARFP